jgi:hypothetical protein
MPIPARLLDNFIKIILTILIYGNFFKVKCKAISARF